MLSIWSPGLFNLPILDDFQEMISSFLALILFICKVSMFLAYQLPLILNFVLLGSLKEKSESMHMCFISVFVTECNWGPLVPLLVLSLSSKKGNHVFISFTLIWVQSGVGEEKCCNVGFSWNLGFFNALFSCCLFSPFVRFLG